MSHNSDEDHGGYKDWHEMSLKSKLKTAIVELRRCSDMYHYVDILISKMLWYVPLCWYFELSNNASIQVCKYASVQVLDKFASMHVWKYVCKYSNMHINEVCKERSKQVYKYASMLLCKYEYIKVCKYSVMQGKAIQSYH